VFVGDTVHVEMSVAELKEASRLGGGIVTMDVRIVNQEDKAVQKGQWTVLVASKSA
jgi:acyl dehydratase